MVNVITSLLNRIKNKIILSRYDEFTIAEYFRKQGAQVGGGCHIVPRSLGTEPYLVKIGNRVTIGAGVKFITHDGGPWIFREEIPDIQVFGPIVIDDNCVIGREAILFPNIKIGPNAIVGAGSVVISDVKPGIIVMGVPARALGSIEKYKEKCIKRWNVQRPPGFDIPPGASHLAPVDFAKKREILKNHLLQVFSKELGL